MTLKDAIERVYTKLLKFDYLFSPVKYVYSCFHKDSMDLAIIQAKSNLVDNVNASRAFHDLDIQSSSLQKTSKSNHEAMDRITEAFQAQMRKLDKEYKDMYPWTKIYSNNPQRVENCQEIVNSLKELKEAYQHVDKFVPTETSQQNVSTLPQTNPLYQLGYSALISGATRFLDEHLQRKQFSRFTQIMATQSVQITLQLASGEDWRTTLAASVPSFLLQYSGASRTKVVLATSAAYLGLMLYKYYYQPEACLSSAIEVAVNVGGTVIGDQVIHYAYTYIANRGQQGRQPRNDQRVQPSRSRQLSSAIFSDLSSRAKAAFGFSPNR